MVNGKFNAEKLTIDEVEKSKTGDFFFFHEREGKKYRFFINGEDTREIKGDSVLDKCPLIIEAKTKVNKGFHTLIDFRVVGQAEAKIVDDAKFLTTKLQSKGLSLEQKRVTLSNITSSIFDKEKTKEENWENIEFLYDKILEMLEDKDG